MAPQNLGAPGSDFLKDISYEMTVRGVGDNGRPVLVTLRAASHRIHGNTRGRSETVISGYVGLLAGARLPQVP